MPATRNSSKKKSHEQSVPTSSSASGSTSSGKYLFFWKPHEPNGWASQWYRSPFTVKKEEGDEEMTFLTCEHWMMYSKAVLFKDEAVAEEILNVKGTSPGDMKKVKGLGRKVSNFEEETWKKERMRIVIEGNRMKFGQNEELKKLLLETGELEIVEASPMDRIWGIGFGAKNAELEKNKNRWGANLLGQAIQTVREELN